MATGSFTPDDPALPINYPGFVFRQLRADGVSSEALLAGTGLSEAQLKDPHFRSTFEPLRRVLLNAIEHTQDPHLGAKLALQFQPTYMGLPFYTAGNAATFVDGIHVLERYFALTFPAFEIRLLKPAPLSDEDLCRLRIRAKFPLHEIEYFSFSSALIVIDRLLRALLQTDRVTLRAETQVAEPEGWSGIAPQLGFPVRFDAAEHQLAFPADILDHALPGADPINHARLLALCEQFTADATFQTTPVAEVTRILERAPDLTIPVAEVAAELGYSERGLRRLLDRSGTSYRKLVDEVREQRARDMLTAGTLPIKAIAGTLGFESSSNFARSFKRWTGMTPKAYRDQTFGGEGPDRK